MRLISIAVTALLTGCSSQGIRPIGPHQYVLIGGGDHVSATADEVCVKLRRAPLPMPMADGIDWGKQFKFQCALPFEVVPAGHATYKIWASPGSAGFIEACETCVPPRPRLPDTEAVFKRVSQSALEYCAKMKKPVVVTDDKFDGGSGVERTFMCADLGQTGLHPNKMPFADLPYVEGSRCINCVPSVYSPETAGAYCDRMDALAFVDVPKDGRYEVGKPIGFSCTKLGERGGAPIFFNIMTTEKR